MNETLRQLLGLGLEARDLSFLQISLRGIIVFVAALAIVRSANKRFLSKMTALDAILGFILASMLARAVNGTASFFPTLGAGFVLAGLHALVAQLAYRSDRFGKWVKGNPEPLVKDGIMNKSLMSCAAISEKDLLEESRLNGPVEEIAGIKLATLERNGQISIIPKQ